ALLRQEAEPLGAVVPLHLAGRHRVHPISFVGRGRVAACVRSGPHRTPPAARAPDYRNRSGGAVHTIAASRTARDATASRLPPPRPPAPTGRRRPDGRCWTAGGRALGCTG